MKLSIDHSPIDASRYRRHIPRPIWVSYGIVVLIRQDKKSIGKRLLLIGIGVIPYVENGAVRAVSFLNFLVKASLMFGCVHVAGDKEVFQSLISALFE